MLNQGWFRNQNNVVCCRKEEVLPKLARELAIPDLSQRVEEFQKTPTAEGVNISGRKRTTLKLLIPNLTFSEPIDMGENVWIYMGELCPAYCLYMPQEFPRASGFPETQGFPKPLPSPSALGYCHLSLFPLVFGWAVCSPAPGCSRGRLLSIPGVPVHCHHTKRPPPGSPG